MIQLGNNKYETGQKESFLFCKEPHNCIVVNSVPIYVGIITPDRKGQLLKFINLKQEYLKVKNRSFRAYKDTLKFDWYLYDLEVRLLTEKQDLSIILDINKRSFKFQLDHIISVKYGYDNKIEPWKIAHPKNLRIITKKENREKAALVKFDPTSLLQEIENTK